VNRPAKGAAVQTATTVELRIAARAENVALARLALTGVAAVAGLRDDDVADLKLAVSEVCTNGVLHAYADRGEEGDPVVVIRYTVSDDAVTVEVLDSGIGFDPQAALVELGSHQPEGHLGLALARAVTDDLEIETGDAGTKVTFSKRR
jgi:serine/threonine-protein kinase RsbW